MTRGGKREGAGRPFGTKKEKTVVYYRRIKPEWVEVFDKKIEVLKMDKEVITRDYYLTYALTNAKGEIYGINQNQSINFANNEVEMANKFYWSEVFVDGNLYSIIRQGILLVNPTVEELQERFKQSKINLN